LGTALLKSFIHTLTELDTPPKILIFYNSGAKLTDKNSPLLPDLQALSDMGTAILTCGACVQFYGLQIGVGSVTNMFEIMDLLMKYSAVRP
jgi:hypothetical protein